MYVTYILESISGNLYIGQTNNITDRLKRHNLNRVKSTKNKGPWKLVHLKEFENRSQSMQYEKFLKSLKSKKYIKENIINNI